MLPIKHIIFAFLLFSSTLWGQFQVNLPSTSEYQNSGDILLLNEDGDFLLTWTEYSYEPVGIESFGIVAQAFTQEFQPLTPPFIVNDYLLTDQENPSTCLLNDGSFVILWLSGSGVALRAKKYNTDLSPFSFEVEVPTSASPSLPKCLGLSHGGFYLFHKQTGLEAIEFDSEMNKISAEIEVISYLGADGYYVDKFSDGSILLVWQDFTRQAQSMGEDLSIIQGPISSLYNSYIADAFVLNDDRFTVFYQNHIDVFDASFTSVVPTIDSSDGLTLKQAYGTKLEDGGFCRFSKEAHSARLHMKCYNQDLTPKTANQRVDQSSAYVPCPCIQLPNGNIAATWDTGSKIQLSLMDTETNFVGKNDLLVEDPLSSISAQKTIRLSDDTLVVIWEISGIWIQKFDLEGNDLSGGIISLADSTGHNLKNAFSLPTGGFVYVGYQYSGELKLQKFDNDLNTIGPLQSLGNSLNSDNQNGDAVALADGSFVITISKSTLDIVIYEVDSSMAIGSEILIHDSENFIRPSIARLNDGSFVLAYEEFTSNYRVRVRHVDASYQLLNDFYASETMPSMYPDVVALDNGGYIVVWIQEGNKIRGKIFDSGSEALGDEVILTSELSETFTKTEVKAEKVNGGNIAVVWVSKREDFYDRGVFGILLDAAGDPIQNPFQINFQVKTDQFGVQIVQYPSGSFLATYLDEYSDFKERVMWKLIDFSSSTISEVSVNQFRENEQRYPRVASLADGGYVVVWKSLDQSSSGWCTYAKRYSEDQSVIVPEFKVQDTCVVGGSTESDVIGTTDGGYIVSWIDANGDIVFNKYTSTNSIEFGPQAVAFSTSSPMNQHSLVKISPDHFLIIWSVDSVSADQIYMEKYDSSGNLVLNGLGQNTTDISDFIFDNWYPSATELQGGNIVVTWQYQQKLYFQLYDSDLSRIGVNTKITVSDLVGNQTTPQIVALQSGGFEVVFPNIPDTIYQYQHIYSIEFDSSGAIQDQKQISNFVKSKNDQISLAQAINASDIGYVATYRTLFDDVDRHGIIAQPIFANGSRMGPQLQVEDLHLGEQENPHIAYLNDGGFVIVYESLSSSHYSYEIRAQRFNSLFQKLQNDNIKTEQSSKTGATICKEEGLPLRLLKNNEIELKATWELVSTTATNNTKNNQIVSMLATSTEVTTPVVPFAYMQNGSNYLFRATYLQETFDLYLGQVQLYKNIGDETCVCPDGAYLNHISHKCSSSALGSISATATGLVGSCPDVELIVSLSVLEQEYWGDTEPMVTWTASSTASTSRLNQLQEFLSEQTSIEVIVSYELIDPQQTYTFRVTTILGEEEDAIYSSSNMIQLTLAAGAFSIRPYETLNIFDSSSVICLSDEEISVDYTQTDGPSINIFENFLTNGDIILPGCALQGLEDYTYAADVYYTNYPSHKISMSFDISVDTEDFVVSIDYLDDEDFNAIVTVTNEYVDECSEFTTVTGFTYDWSCEYVQTTGGPTSSCIQPEYGSIFSTPQTTNTITIPHSRRINNIQHELELTVNRGTVTQTANIIVKDSFIRIVENSPPSRCGVSLTAQYSAYEHQNHEVTLKWSLDSSDATNSIRENELILYLESFSADNSNPNLEIPERYLEPGATYTFHIEYENYFGEILEDTLTLSTPIPDTPNLHIENGWTQSLETFIDHEIEVELECIPGGFESYWDQIEGPDLAIENNVTPRINSRINIHQCDLEEGEEYIIKYIAEEPDFSLTTETILTIHVEPTTFDIKLRGGDTTYPVNYDISLETTILSVGNCPAKLSIYQFIWNCEVFTMFPRAIQQCSQLEGLTYNSPSSSQSITIPQENLLVDQMINIHLTVVKGSIERDIQSTIKISKVNVFPIYIFCLTQPCHKYSFQSRLTFNATSLFPNVDISGLEFTWQVDPEEIQIIQFANQINLLETEPFENGISPQVIIDLLVSNGSQYGTFVYSLPLNQPPAGGRLDVMPASGESLRTQFQLSAPGWQDDDYPLRYRFSFKPPNNTDDYLGLSTTQESMVFTTILTSLGQNIDVDIQVYVLDVYSANTSSHSSVYLTSSFSGDLEETINSLQEALENAQNISDQTLKSQQLSIISHEIAYYDEQVINNATQNKSCTLEQFCECSNDSNFVQYCESYSSSVIDLKEAILNDIEDAIQEFGSDVDRGFSLEAISSLIENSELNSDKTILKASDILDLLLDPNIYSDPLTGSEESSASKAVDSMIQYASDQNCEADGEIVDMLKQNMETYLDALAASFLERTVPGESPSIQLNNHYNIYLQRLPACKIEGFIIDFGDLLAPQVMIQNEQKRQSCLRDAIIKCYVFNDQIFDCEEKSSRGNQKKEIVILSIGDSVTGEKFDSNYVTFIQKVKEEDECEIGCSEISGDTSLCECEHEASIFDFDEQIDRVFQKSNLGKIVKALNENWVLVDKAQFYMIAIVSIVSVLGGIYLHRKNPNYCVVEEIQKKEKPSALLVFGSLFAINHSLLNIFLLNAAPVSKTSRLLVFYGRLLMMMAIISILGSSSGINFSQLSNRRLDDIGLSLDVYILLIPYFTFVPFELIMLRLLKTNNEPNLSKLRQKCSKCSKILAISILLLCSIICIFVILSIAEASSTDENIEWILLFLQTLAQDWIVTPLIFIILTLAISNPNSTRIINTKNQVEEETKKQKTIKWSQIAPLNMEAQNKEILENKNLRSCHKVFHTEIQDEVDLESEKVGMNSPQVDSVNVESDRNEEEKHSTPPQSIIEVEHKIIKTETNSLEEEKEASLGELDIESKKSETKLLQDRKPKTQGTLRNTFVLEYTDSIDRLFDKKIHIPFVKTLGNFDHKGKTPSISDSENSNEKSE